MRVIIFLRPFILWDDGSIICHTNRRFKSIFPYSLLMNTDCTKHNYIRVRVVQLQEGRFPPGLCGMPAHLSSRTKGRIFEGCTTSQLRHYLDGARIPGKSFTFSRGVILRSTCRSKHSSQIKTRSGFWQVLLPGLQKMRTGWRIAATAHNLLKIIGSTIRKERELPAFG